MFGQILLIVAGFFLLGNNLLFANDIGGLANSDKSGDIRKIQAQNSESGIVPQSDEESEEVYLIHLDKGEVIKTNRVWEESGVVKFLRHGVEMGYPKERIKKIEKAEAKKDGGGITKDYLKPKDSTRRYKNNAGICEVWTKSNNWHSFEKVEGIEFSLEHDSEVSHIFLAIDGTTKSSSELRESIIAEMKRDGSKPKVVYSDKRMVNAKEVLCLEIKAIVKEVPVIYFGYYWSGNAGTIHFYSVTEESVFEKCKKDIVELLNGLVIKRD